jgi:hypothetical protein
MSAMSKSGQVSGSIARTLSWPSSTLKERRRASSSALSALPGAGLLRGCGTPTYGNRQLSRARCLMIEKVPLQ